MNRYYGIDAGNCECRITVLSEEKDCKPRPVLIKNQEMIDSAYALLKNGNMILGEQAFKANNALLLRSRYKHRFPTDMEAVRDVRGFAAAIFHDLQINGLLNDMEHSYFSISCPDDWSRNTCEQYCNVFEQCGFMNVNAVRDSHAVFADLCSSSYMQNAYGILDGKTLAVDIGASKIICASLSNGRVISAEDSVFEAGLEWLDEEILRAAVGHSDDSNRIQRYIRTSKAWHERCLYVCRKLKEEYLNNTDDGIYGDCSISLPIEGDRHLILHINNACIEEALKSTIYNHSDAGFERGFKQCLLAAGYHTGEDTPDLIILTGGGSQISQFRKWCRDVYPKATVKTAERSSFTISEGLAYQCRKKYKTELFKKLILSNADNGTVRKTVIKNMSSLLNQCTAAIAGPALQDIILPIIRRWRDGSIEKLSDIDAVMIREMSGWFGSDAMKQLLEESVRNWFIQIEEQLSRYTDPLCSEYGCRKDALRMEKTDRVITITAAVLHDIFIVCTEETALPLNRQLRTHGAMSSMNIAKPLRRVIAAEWSDNKTANVTEQLKNRIDDRIIYENSRIMHACEPIEDAVIDSFKDRLNYVTAVMNTLYKNQR
jgi:hypothetical protein